MLTNSILFEHLFISDIYSWDIDRFDGEVGKYFLSIISNFYLFKKEIIIKNKRLFNYYYL